MSIKGTTAQCLEDFFRHYQWESIQPFFAQYAGVEKGTVRRWFNGNLPVGAELLKVRVLLDLLGYDVAEFEELPPPCRRFAQAIAFGLVTADDAALVLNYQNTQSLYSVLLRNQAIQNQRWHRMDRWLANHKGQLEQAVEAIQPLLESLPKEPDFAPAPAEAPSELEPAPKAPELPPVTHRQPILPGSPEHDAARMVSTGSRLAGPLSRSLAYGLMGVSELLDALAASPDKVKATAQFHNIIQPEDVQEIMRKLDRLSAPSG